ncbi:MAG: ATPase [Clostridia bacterium]|nr:ATPase [Clostridia bacterium]MDD4386763.1 ATPase [Clostridia bacterium]
MEIFTLLENLEELVENSSKVPFSSKVMVDKEELGDILEEIRLKLPDELKQAKRIKDERLNILNDAQKESDELLKDAENKIIQMVDEHVITKQAIMQKEEIVENANKISKEISCGTRDYADAILEKVEDVLRETMQVVHNNRKELK